MLSSMPRVLLIISENLGYCFWYQCHLSVTFHGMKNYPIHPALRVHCKVFPFLSFTSNILKSSILTYLIKFGFKNFSSKNGLWPAFRNPRAHISSLTTFTFAVCCWSISPTSCWLKSNLFENLCQLWYTDVSSVSVTENLLYWISQTL